jgi:hypothetical protein
MVIIEKNNYLCKNLIQKNYEKISTGITINY